MKKKILSLLLSICMVSGGLPVTALAADDFVTEDFTSPTQDETEEGEFAATEEEIPDAYTTAASNDFSSMEEAFSDSGDGDTTLLETPTDSILPDYSWYTSNSSSDTYEISDVGDLLGFANIVNNTTTDSNITQNSFAGKTVNLASDIDLSGVDWKPIGGLISYPSITFSGTFNGNNHTISNMTTSDYTPNDATAGFFGSITGTVENLILDNITISSTHYAGGIVGYSSNGGSSKIINCHVKSGTITSTPEQKEDEYDNGDKVGGIIGYCTTGDKVNNCSVSNVTLRAYRDIGGIAGYSDGTITGNKVGEKVKLIQDNTNSYKEGSMLSYVGSIIGRGNINNIKNNTGQAVISLISDVNIGETSLEIKDCVLDLNGCTLSGTPANDSSVLNVSGNFTLCDSSESHSGTVKAEGTGKNKSAITVKDGKTVIQGGNVSADWGIKVLNNANLEMTGGNINASSQGIRMEATQPGMSVTISDGAVISSESCGITVFNMSSSDANKPVLNINGGEINGNDFGISGNGTRHHTEINISGGYIEGKATGIYHPQDGILNICGGTVEGGTGIEIRSGALTVTGGTITGTAPFCVVQNGSGTTTDGAGIAIAQHTTKLPVNVNISAGNISGYYAIYESNPQNNATDDLKNVVINITGGYYQTINGGPVPVYSQDKTGFISGGYFSNDKSNLSQYIAPGYYLDGNTVKPVPAPVLSSNNYLSGLTISQGTLSPAFDRSNTTYTAEVENETEYITVTPVKESSWSSVKVNDKPVTSGTASENITLKEGSNTITVRVTAENGSVKDYIITVTRKEAPAPIEDPSDNQDSVGTPVIKTVKVSGNQAEVYLTGICEKADGYDFVIGKNADCITSRKYIDIRKNITETKAKFSYVQQGTYYAFCHAWKKVDGKKVFSAWSQPYKFKVTAVTVKEPVITSVTVKGRTVTVKIKNSKSALGTDTILGKELYKDQYGKRPVNYGKLVAKNKTTSTITFKNVPKGTYYVGTHAFNRSTANKGKVFSKWSNIKKIVVK